MGAAVGAQVGAADGVTVGGRESGLQDACLDLVVVQQGCANRSWNLPWHYYVRTASAGAKWKFGVCGCATRCIADRSLTFGQGKQCRGKNSR